MLPPLRLQPVWLQRQTLPKTAPTLATAAVITLQVQRVVRAERNGFGFFNLLGDFV